MATAKTVKTVEESGVKATSTSEDFAKDIVTALSNKTDKAGEKRAKDTEYVRTAQAKFLARCKNAKVKKIKLSKAYSTYFGKKYTFNYNGVPVFLEFDGKMHAYPDFVADYIKEKIERTMIANMPEVSNEKM